MTAAGQTEASGLAAARRRSPIVTSIRDLVTSRRAWLRDLPARTALRISNQPLVRAYTGRMHRNALARHAAHVPVLGGEDARIVETLEREGVYVTNLEALGLSESDEVLSTACELIESFTATARARAATGEAFIYVPPEQVAARPAIFSWGLQDRLLDIAEAYIGLPVAYDGVCINYTVADGREVSTRKWHRDWEDRRMLKVAVYLNDVDDAGGPFQMIRRHDAMQSDSAGFCYDLADDKELERRLGPDFTRDVVSCRGLTGTVVFTDTARFFHRGKPATARDRGAIFYSYFASPPRHPFLCERTGMSRRDIKALARDLPARQRAAALWRMRVPAVLRLIPPATL